MRLHRAALLVLAAITLKGEAGPSSPVVTPSWLGEHLSDPDLVLLHVGEKAEYENGHIPGARFVALSEVSVSDRTGGGLTLEMLPAEDLRQRLAGLGVSDGSRVVVYPGKDWLSPTTRLIFTLDYAGLGARTALLDGGMDAWIAEGRLVTSEVPAPRAGNLSPLKTRPIVVDAGRVRESLGKPGVVVVDGRSASFYDGVDTGGPRERQHCTGHISGARSIPFTSVFDDSGKLRSTEELRSLFGKAGVMPRDTVIAYCHIGQQATAVLFAARTLGHPVLLYDGSFEDWSRHAGFPVEGPEAKSD